ncbi:MAG: hypothetical protein U9R19_04255 [Bacteroidota bacterium]|nr:hypothetical protein [Bacteroidota bacterium]
MTEKEKFKKKIIEITGSKNNIPGIYNYCDRWCEHCNMTQYCSNFQLGKEMGWDGEKNDLENEKFWNRLSMVFEATFEMVSESAKEKGIDLNNLPDVERLKHIDSEVETISHDYSHKIIKWLDENSDAISQKAEQIAIVSKDKLVQFTDAIEVIQWYSIFISTKIHRAHFELDNRDEDFPDDNQGTAKIALIAISRSIQSFTYIYNNWHEKEDEILEFLSTLSKTKRIMLSKFPDAMDFKRPGFDD